MSLILSLLGCFALFVITKNAEIPDRRVEEVLGNGFYYLAVILTFNIIGFAMTWLGSRIKVLPEAGMRFRTSIILYIISTMAIFFVINYIMLVSTKIIARIDEPFQLSSFEISAVISLWIIELIIIGQHYFNRFYSKMLELNAKTSELEEKNLRAQYNLLQSQINPHFLFNSLNTLMSEIEEDPKNAVEFTGNLAEVYRYILINQDNIIVPLESELEFVNAYVFLYSVRLGNCVTMEVDIPQKCNSMLLPPLTLQILVENIFKHNVIYPGKDMVVHISADEQLKRLTVSNIVRPKKDAVSSGKGLRNLLERYRFVSGKDISIVRENGEFRVSVPLLSRDDLRVDPHSVC